MPPSETPHPQQQHAHTLNTATHPLCTAIFEQQSSWEELTTWVSFHLLFHCTVSLPSYVLPFDGCTTTAMLCVTDHTAGSWLPTSALPQQPCPLQHVAGMVFLRPTDRHDEWHLAPHLVPIGATLTTWLPVVSVRNSLRALSMHHAGLLDDLFCVPSFIMPAVLGSRLPLFEGTLRSAAVNLCGVSLSVVVRRWPRTRHLCVVVSEYSVSAPLISRCPWLRVDGLLLPTYVCRL